MTDLKNMNLSSADIAVAGAISGFISRFCSQPLDVLKILFQLQADTGTASKYKSIKQAARLIVREEGVKALWKGHMPAQLLSIAFGAVQFSSYEKVMSLNRNINSKNAILGDSIVHLYAGGIAGIAATLCSFPFDTIRTRLVAQSQSRLYKGIFDAAGKIWIHEGWRGFFKGVVPASCQTAPLSGLTFAFKNIYNVIWNWCFQSSHDHSNSTRQGHIITGLLAGVSAKTIVYPLDVVKKRLQIQGMRNESIILNKITRCSGVASCISMILKDEGFYGFYKGIWPSLLKAGVTNSINFTVYYEICYLIDYLKR